MVLFDDAFQATISLFGRAAKRRIIVDREDRNGALAPMRQNGCLARKPAIAIDARVQAALRNEVAVREELCRGVVNSDIRVCASRHSRLDERWIDAGIVRERGDEGRVDAQSISLRQDRLSLWRVLDQPVH